MRRVLVALAALTCEAPAAASAEPVLLAHEQRPTPVSVFGGHVVWSSFVPATGRYALIEHADGRTRTLPIKPRGVPFDADIGLARDGSVVVTYSRCGREPPNNSFRDRLPDYAAGRGCRLFELDLARGRERRLAGGRGSEVLPSRWRARLAFVRRPSPGTRDARRQRQVLIRDLRTGVVRRVRRGGRRDPPLQPPFPLRLDLRERRVAVLWTGVPRARPCPGMGAAQAKGGFVQSEIWLAGTGSARRVAVGCSPLAIPQVFGASLTSRAVVHGVGPNGVDPPGWTLRRVTVGIGRATREALPEGTRDVSADDGMLALTRDAQGAAPAVEVLLDTGA